MKRKAINKKDRYEIFKRDSFTCQYCGRKAPDVVLEIDHIKPVSKGGTNDIFNLVTSCFDCNRGKGNRELDDGVVIEKQMDELEQLNERRKQIEMIFEWRNELSSLDDETSEMVLSYLNENFDITVTETGIPKVKSWIKKYELKTLLEAIDTSFEQYEDNEKAFNMIPRIIYHKENKTPQWKQDLFYIRGIARNRYGYINEWKLIEMLEEAHIIHEYSIDDLKDMVFECKNWTQLKNTLEGIMYDS